MRLTVCAGCNHACECWGSSLRTITSCLTSYYGSCDEEARPFPHLYCSHSPIITGGWFEVNWLYGLTVTFTVKIPSLSHIYLHFLCRYISRTLIHAHISCKFLTLYDIYKNRSYCIWGKTVIQEKTAWSSMPLIIFLKRSRRDMLFFSFCPYQCSQKWIGKVAKII